MPIPSALDPISLHDITLRINSAGHVLLCLDYDGTLTPIVERPEDAVLSDDMRSLLNALTVQPACTLAIISGRDRDDVRNLVGIDRAWYAGSHGFDIIGPPPQRIEKQHEEGLRILPDLDAAQHELAESLRSIPGGQVERKRFSIAVHYRRVAPDRVHEVERAMRDIASRHPTLRVVEGKKVWDFQPRVDWHKGRAVEWLLTTITNPQATAYSRKPLPIYLGDDTTDEDAFRAVAACTPVGIGILVANDSRPTDASFLLRDVHEAERFLSRLHEVFVGI